MGIMVGVAAAHADVCGQILKQTGGMDIVGLGLFESAVGMDEESSSGDGLASLAVKIWGRVVGDANMEKRGTFVHDVTSQASAMDLCLRANALVSIQAISCTQSKPAASTTTSTSNQATQTTQPLYFLRL
jgi:endoglucanase Acf2